MARTVDNLLRGTPISIYVTLQDRKRRTSKSFTVRGFKLTPAKLAMLFKQSLRNCHRKAG